MAKKKMESKAAIFIVGLLIFGTTTAITAKIQYQTCSKGDGGMKKFNRPWLESMTMFVAMSFSMVLHSISRCCKARREKHKQDQLLLNEYKVQEEKGEGPSSFKLYFLIMIPALLDLVATTLAGVGLLWVDASVYQMLRGSLMIFSAMLSIFCLGKKLRVYHWYGIILCVIAVAMVGTASIEDAQGSASTNVSLQIFGIVLIILGQFVQAMQIVTEEKMLKNFKAPPLVIVGMEGIWGVLWMIMFLLILYYTPPLNETCTQEAICECEWTEQCTQWAPDEDHFALSTDCQSHSLYHENTIESLKMIASSTELTGVICIYLFAILFYNISGMNVTKHLSAIHRSILEACRTLCIWLVDLIIYYAIKWDGHGEKWTKWSILQLFGFMLLVMGNLIYNKIIKLPKIFPGVEDKPYRTRVSKTQGNQFNFPGVSNYSPRRAQALPNGTPVGSASEDGFTNYYPNEVSTTTKNSNIVPVNV